jgi:hypothetical protein
MLLPILIVLTVVGGLIVTASMLSTARRRCRAVAVVTVPGRRGCHREQRTNDRAGDPCEDSAY